MERLPVAVIGAGPIGLAAAAHLVARGERPLVLEAGERVGAAVAAWGHVRMFSPWAELVDPATRELLLEASWEEPDPPSIPTGAELRERLLEPLAALPSIAPHLRLGHRVVGVSRGGTDKLASSRREDVPFTLVVTGPEGRMTRVSARAVIDASGTFGSPNPLGADGFAVPGEEELRARIRYGTPDVLGAERHRYAGRRTLVAGAGHSAHHAVLDLARLAAEAPGTEVVWALRRGGSEAARGGRPEDALPAGRTDDALPARAALEARIRALVAGGTEEGRGAVEVVTGFRARGLRARDGALSVEGERGSIRADELVVATGYRPELRVLRELRLELDPRLESPVRLAPLIDPDLHDCGSVQPHGYEALRHPERDFYLVGMKSYGRAPSFLLLTGYEQVRSVVAALSGNLEEAGRVRLTLPAGVCSGGASAAGSCCAPVRISAPIPLGRPAENAAPVLGRRDDGS